VGVLALPTIARADQERKSPLTNAPVVRRRLELRDKRVELGVGVGATVGQDFYNALLIMPKLAFHFNDWLSLAAVGGYNATPTSWPSSFNNDVYNALVLQNSSSAADTRSPNANDARATMNHITYLAVGQVEFIPLSGKIALLNSIFSYFDFYILGGAGVINLAAPAQPQSCQRAGEPSQPICQAHTGSELTFNAGVGAHAFLTHWAALNIELRDLIYKNNASGRSVLGNLYPADDLPVTTSADLEWTNNYLVSLNIQFFFPTTPKISR